MLLDIAVTRLYSMVRTAAQILTVASEHNMQGEVEQIAMMKPKGDDKNETGLLEYLEDIIGTDQYKQPIEEAAAKLEELNDQRQTAVHRVKRAGVLTFCRSNELLYRSSEYVQLSVTNACACSHMNSVT
jgi:hypothetical protein